MFLFFLIFAATSVNTVVSRHDDPANATMTVRQTSSVSAATCNSTCTMFYAMDEDCNILDIDTKCCTETYLELYGNCDICSLSQSGVGEKSSAISAQIPIDVAISSCHDLGIPLNVNLNFSPAQRVVINQLHLVDSQLRHRQTVFFALQVVGGQVGLVIVLLSAIIPNSVHRDLTLFNFCITWIFSSIVYSLSLYHGTYGNTLYYPLQRQKFGECLAQARLIPGIQVMTACSTMALVIQLWTNLRLAIYGENSLHGKKWTRVVLLTLPYVLFLAFTVPLLVLLEKPSSLPFGPTDFYCSVYGPAHLLRSIYGVTLTLLVVGAIFDGLLIVILYRHWNTFRYTQMKSPVSLSILVRVILFSMYRIIVAVTYGAVLDRPTNGLSQFKSSADYMSAGIPVWVDMLQAALPLAAFLTLGTNENFFRALIFWRKRKVNQAPSGERTTSHDAILDIRERS